MALDRDGFIGQAMPQDSTLPTVLTGQHFEGLENFFRTFCVRNDDKMVFLCDRKLDPQVIAAYSAKRTGDKYVIVP